MSETSPTEQVDGNTGSADADLPDNTSNNQSADGQQTESVSSDTQDADQNDNNQPDNQSTGDDSSSSDDDDGLAKFAKAQGFDPDDLTDNERRALKLAHDNQKAYRSKAQDDSEALKETLADTERVDEDELEDLDPTEARLVRQDSEIAELRAAQRSDNFFTKHPEALEFETEMGEIIIKEAQTNGKDAARYLSKDLNRVFVLAKAARGDSDEAARAEGARAERERLRKAQEGSADGGQASSTHTSGKKLSRADIDSMDDEDYKKLRDSGELDAIIARGDLY